MIKVTIFRGWHIAVLSSSPNSDQHDSYAKSYFFNRENGYIFFFQQQVCIWKLTPSKFVCDSTLFYVGKQLLPFVENYVFF